MNDNNSAVSDIMDNNLQSQHLQHIANVLQQLGYQLDKDQWLVFWSHDYPFTSHRALMMNLKSNQKV